MQFSFVSISFLIDGILMAFLAPLLVNKNAFIFNHLSSYVIQSLLR